MARRAKTARHGRSRRPALVADTCHGCGVPEVIRLIGGSGGVPYSNLSPVSRLCIDCLNKQPSVVFGMPGAR